MVDCPKCSTKLDADFGMVTCPTCHSVVFVEFEGSAKIAEDDPQFPAPSGRSPSERSQTEIRAQQIAEQESELPAPDLSAFDDAVADSLFAPGTLESQQMVNPGDVSQAREPEATAAPELFVPQDEILSPDDPLGVTAYANSEFSQGKDGPFVFNLFIDGLDSKEIRESLREAMNDSRFGWDTNKLIGQIRDGSLQLRNLSPVQASILVNRLKRLSLSISWEQNAITTVKNSRAKERALQIERIFLNDLLWFAFLVATAILFLPLATHAGDFQHHEAKLRALEVEIKKHEEELRKLAQHKAHTNDSREKESLHKEMLALHKVLQQASESYNNEKTHIRFKHPEKGEKTERRYSRHTLQPLEEFEDVSLDGKLDSFLTKFHRVYGKPEPTKEAATESQIVTAPATATATAKEDSPQKREVASKKKKKVIDPDSMDQQFTLSK